MLWMPCHAAVWCSAWADQLLITFRLVSLGFWKEHLSSYHNDWFIAFGISVNLNQSNWSITLLTDGLCRVYLTVFNTFLRISQCKNSMTRLMWVILQRCYFKQTHGDTWYTLYRTNICSCVSFKQSELKNKHSAVALLYGVQACVCTDLGLCWSNMNE